MGCMVQLWPKLPSSKPEAPLLRLIPRPSRPLKTPRSCTHLLAETRVHRPALTGSFGSKKCPVRPTPLTPARARKVPDAAGALLSLVKPVSTTRRAGQGRRSAGMQAECVQGSEDLRQLHVGTMPRVIPNPQGR
jgi:hypothetical protein